MGWDRGRYYTRSRKVGGRVVREYVGGGVVGELAAQLDHTERVRRRVESEGAKALAASLAGLDASLNDLSRECDLLARAALLAAGYRRHHRGDWRRKREDPEAP